MNETHEKCLDAFPDWIRNLGTDAESLGELLREPGLPASARNAVAGALNYLFKSIDLIPDGIDDIGYLDDAFVMRVAAQHAMQDDPAPGSSPRAALDKLAADATLVRTFLAADYSRLEAYVRSLRGSTARGRSVDDVLEDDAVLDAFISDVRGFSRAYKAPGFRREERLLIKLRAFLDAKLPK